MTLAFWLAGCASPSPLAGPSVDAHNRVRRPLDLPDLDWDQELAAEAQEWIEHLASNESCALIHDGTTGHGENLYWSTQSAGIEAAVEAWAEEAMYYDLASNSCADGEQCGHYTQIVWSTTERVGCAVLDCGDGSEIAMCTYDPPGNFIGERPF